MKTRRKYRDNGAAGALLDEYERALEDLKMLIGTLSADQLSVIVDPETTDSDCRSIQSILTHVVRAGYNYAIAIRRSNGEDIAYKNKLRLDTGAAYIVAMDLMFQYNERVFEDYPNLQMDAHAQEDKMKLPWGQYFDVDQLMEHAIVHILRHRRQIERFLLKMESAE